MWWRDGGAEGAGWFVADFLDGIAPALRASGNLARAVELYVRHQVGGKIDGAAIRLVIFQGELVGSGINLAEVIDAGVGGVAVRSNVESAN